MSTVLQINNLSKDYGVIKAVNDLTINIEKGDVFGILGPNGSGKTTTLSIILGIIKQKSGNFVWHNNEPNKLINKKIGALVEQPNFYPYLSILDNLKIAAEIKGITNKKQEIDRVLKIVNLSERRLSRFKTLSFGMKQRLTIASILLGDPQVLIFDEPTNGLDPEGIVEVREIIISEAKKGKTIILASHILDEVEKVCTHVAILKKGQLIKQGKVSEIVKADDLIIISTDKLEDLHNALARSGMYKTLNKENNELILTLEEKYSPTDINKFAFDNGFVLSKFEVKKKSLEEQFLEIVK